MSQTNRSNQQKKVKVSQIMKNLEANKTLNSFMTNCQFTRDIGVELMKGPLNQEYIEVLEKSMEGIFEFTDLLQEKLKENKAT